MAYSWPASTPRLMLAGHVTAGAIVSMTFAKNTHDLELSALSNTVHWTALAPSRKVVPLVALHDVFLMPEPSVTVGVPNVTAAVAVLPVVCAVALAGQVMAGAVVSVTSILKVQVAVFAEVSVAVQVTVVEPRARVEPDAGEQVVDCKATLSVAVAANVAATVGVLPFVGVNARSAGHVMAAHKQCRSFKHQRLMQNHKT